MKVKCIINIKKNNRIIGNCFVDKKLSSEEMLSIAKDIIDNYNKRLATYRSDYAKVGTRILLQSDKFGDDKKAPAGLTEKSYEYLKKNLVASNLEKIKDKEYMYISTISSHNDKMLKCEDYYSDILIDFDLNIINCNILGKMDRTNYELENNHPYNVLEQDMQNMAFNDLEDTIMFFKNQKEKGFLKKGKLNEVYLAFH